MKRNITYLTNNWNMIVTMAAVMTTTTAKMIIRINILGSLSDMLAVSTQSGGIRKRNWLNKIGSMQ